jgi:regulator of nucleoside diphosphate kinase
MNKGPATMTENPPVVLDAAYVARLQTLASSAMNVAPDVADRLLNEIDRATVLPSGDVPSHVVNIGSEVTFRDNDAGRVQTVILVLPQHADIAQRRVSVLTPIGAALIGLAEGASIDWETRDGETRQLTVLRVVPSGAELESAPGGRLRNADG